MAPRGDAEELARKISIGQAHVHVERQVQREVNDLVYGATRMLESNDRGEVVTGEVREQLLIALEAAQALSQKETPEVAGWWIGRYLERRAAELESPSEEEEEDRQPAQAGQWHRNGRAGREGAEDRR